MSAIRVDLGQRPTVQQQLDTMWDRVRENGKVIAALERDQANEIAAYAVARMTEKERERTAEPVEPPPLTMAERADLDAYGCRHRADRLREIADAKGLSLSNASQRIQAEAALFAESGSGVMQARTLAEGIHAMARDKGLSFVELKDGGTYAQLCQAVVTLRPDLKPDYRAGRATASIPTDPLAERDRLVKRTCERRGWDFDDDRERMQAQAVVFSEHPHLARAVYESEQAPTRRPDPDHDKAVQFIELVEAALRDQDCPATPTNRVKAAKAVAREFPHLAPREYRR